MPHYGYSVTGVAHGTALTAATGLGLWCYLVCVFVDPGAVPLGWTPDPEASGGAAVVQVKRSGAPRRCQKCDAWKPPRAHHCRRCGRCVLRMDHHCVWLNNCVGHGNYRAFFQMAFFLGTAAGHAAALLLALNASLAQLALGWDPEAKASEEGGSLGRSVGWGGPFWAHAALQLVATAAAVPLSLSLVTLLVWNCTLLGANKTTIEHHEGVAAKLSAAAAADGSAAAAHPWDLGDWHANVEATFGEDPAWWVAPWDPAAEGSGATFRTRWDGGGGGPAPAAVQRH